VNAFYITTPIYYVNSTPHIGHAYTTIAADVVDGDLRTTMHAGAELWFGMFALRSGISRDQNQKMQFAGGGGYRFGKIGLDMAVATNSRNIERQRGAELKRQLVRAAIAASTAIKSELPNSRLVSPEPVIHIIGDPQRQADVHEAEAYRTSMFEAWDMLAGRLHPELGGKEAYLDVIGVNYYERNQWRNHGETIFRGEADYRPFHKILEEVHKRYSRPMFVSETGNEDERRQAWLAYIGEEVQAARKMGVELHGICLYPILNHPGWEDDRHCHNGLWDYPDPDGSREIYQALASEVRTQEGMLKRAGAKL